MGNWRTVNVIGNVSEEEAIPMRQILASKNNWDENIDYNSLPPIDCFKFVDSLCGLDEWVKPNGNINAIGNLAERDYDNDDIEKALKYLAEKFPSLELTLHSGSDYEDLTCSATFIVKDGKVIKEKPQIEKLQEINQDMMFGRMMRMLR